MRVKQRIAHVLIHEISANANDDKREIVLVIHWVGVRHSEVRWPDRRLASTATGPARTSKVSRGAWRVGGPITISPPVSTGFAATAHTKSSDESGGLRCDDGSPHRSGTRRGSE
jgi:hypothetical protein